MENKNDKIVYIRRLPISNSEKSASNETKEYFDQGNRPIGSYFVKDSVRPGTGLTVPEENLLMPNIIDLAEEDREFRKTSTNFFHDIQLKIPAHNIEKNVGGLRLNISLEDDDKELGANIGTAEKPRRNLPKFPSDYVKWRFCLAHPLVSSSLSRGTGDMLKEFYIFDELVVNKEKDAKHTLEDKAMTIYLSLKDDAEKVHQLLVVLNVAREVYYGKENETLKIQAINNPEMFIKMTKSAQLQNLALLKEMVEAKIVTRAGDRLVYTDTKSLFAVDNNEAIGYLQDPANSEDVLRFKSLIAEYRKIKNAE